MSTPDFSLQRYPEVISYAKGRKPCLIQNDWKTVGLSGDQNAGLDELPAGKVLLPFRSLAHASSTDRLTKRAMDGDLGVWFSADDDVLKHEAAIQAGKKWWPLIAVDFPIFRDGRGFSTAVLLRERLGWQREIRAIGDVLIDQLLPLARVGFDAFDLREDQDIALGLEQFNLYSVTLQDSWRTKRSTVKQRMTGGAL